MTDNSTEWGSGNSHRHFPLAEISSIPQSFLLDARLILSPWEGDEAHVVSIAYDSGDDEFVLTVLARTGALEETVEFGPLPRREDPLVPDVGRGRSAANGSRVLLFVPGEAWDDPVAHGILDGTTEFPDGTARIHPQRVHPGPSAFKGFVLKAPFHLEGGAVSNVDEAVPGPWDPAPRPHETLMAGHNITFSGGAAGEILLSMVPGAGEGPVPCPDSACSPPILSINGTRPGPDGAIHLVPRDCLRMGGDGEGGLRLFSDCVPCCRCRDYTAASRALSRRSAKIKDANDELLKLIECSQASYDEAISLINQQSPGIVSVHSIQSYPSRIYMTVQNLSGTPVYAVLSIALPDGSDVILGPTSAAMEGIQKTIPPLKDLHAVSSDSGLTEPEDSEGWEERDLTFTVGYGDDFSPIPPGQSTRLYIYSPSFESLMGTLSGICDAMDDVYASPGTEKSALFLGDSILQDLILDYTGGTFWSNEWYEHGGQDHRICAWMPDSCASGSTSETEVVYGGVKDLVGMGTPTCVQKGEGTPSGTEGVDYILVRASCPDIYQIRETSRAIAYGRILARKAELLFSQEVCGEAIATEDQLDLFEKARTFDEPGGETVLLYLNGEVEAAVESLMTLYGEAIAACVDGGAIWESIPLLEVCAAPIYGSTNFGCKAFVGDFITREDEREGDAYQCLERTLDLFEYSLDL